MWLFVKASVVGALCLSGPMQATSLGRDLESLSEGWLECCGDLGVGYSVCQGTRLVMSERGLTGFVLRRQKG